MKSFMFNGMALWIKHLAHGVKTRVKVHQTHIKVGRHRGYLLFQYWETETGSPGSLNS